MTIINKGIDKFLTISVSNRIMLACAFFGCMLLSYWASYLGIVFIILTPIFALLCGITIISTFMASPKDDK